TSGNSRFGPGHLRSEVVLMNRIEVFRKMLETDSQNATVRFGLANELVKNGRFEEAVSELHVYLSQADDQGAAYGMLARALEKLDRTDEARTAYEQGIAGPRRFQTTILTPSFPPHPFADWLITIAGGDPPGRCPGEVVRHQPEVCRCVDFRFCSFVFVRPEEVER